MDPRLRLPRRRKCPDMRYALSKIAALLFLMLVILSFFLPACSKKSKTPESAKPPSESASLSDWNRASISGQVLTPDSPEHSGILVFAAGTSFVAYTDEKGNFTILDVAVGTYTFEAQKTGYKNVSLGKVTIDGSPEEPAEPAKLPTVVLEKLSAKETGERYGGLIGQVELENQTGGGGVLVQIQGTLFKTVTDDAGVYRFFNLAPKAYTLGFSKRGFAARTVSVNVLPGEPTYASPLRLKPLVQPIKYRKIYGVVDMYDLKGEPTNKFDTAIITLEGTSYLALLDSEGKFVFNKIPPGQYTLNAVAPGFQNRSKIDIDLTDLEYTNVSVILDQVPSESEKLGAIRGVASLEDADDDSGISVALMGTSIVAITDVVGHYVLSSVPPGTYTVLAQAEGYFPEKIEAIDVKEGEEVELDEITLEIRVEPPEVVYTDPGDGQMGVLVKKIAPLYVRFSKKMKPGTVKRAFSISPATDYRIFMGREHRQSDFDLLFVQLLGASEKDPLDFDTRYTVTISTAATDYENVSLEEDYKFTFTTGKASIIETRPGEGESSAFVNLQRPIHIYFNATINPDTVNNDTVDITPEPETIPRFTFVNDPDTGWTEVHIFSQLKPDTRYTLTLHSGIQTNKGSYISNIPYRLHFRTAKRRELREFYEIPP